MQIIITGAAGFLGHRLQKALVKSNIEFDELLLVDVVTPVNATNDRRVICQPVDLSLESAARSLITSRTGLVFHLAAVVSSHAEKEFDLGWRINLDITRWLLEACRHTKPDIRFIFSSSLAVYGGSLPAIVDDTTAVMPSSSYGAQKAMSELLVNDYSRKNFVDGIVLRLPTICVRPGRPNQAASSFVSSIIREPMNGEDAICPVSPDLVLWLSSPDTIIRNLIHASTLDLRKGDWRTINLPGISVSVRQMLESLKRVTGDWTAEKVRFKPDANINRIVSTWPGVLDNGKALTLGFHSDKHFDEFIRQHITDKETHEPL